MKNKAHRARDRDQRHKSGQERKSKAHRKRDREQGQAGQEINSKSQVVQELKSYTHRIRD
jgi:hypothetical protein